MKGRLLSGLLGSLAVTALAAGCAHGNGAESKNGVRIASVAQEVAGCEKLTDVRLAGTWTSGAGKQELVNLVRAKGGNVLLLTQGSGTPSGTAYRCSDVASTGGGSAAPSTH